MDDQEKQERLVEAAVALLESVSGQRMQVTNLNKALFYMDLAALRDRGQTITGWTYVAMENGPVLNDYKDNLVKVLASRSLARQDDLGLGKPVVLMQRIASFKFLDDFARGLASTVGPFVASHSASDISELTHLNPGWRIAYAKGAARKLAPAPINMRIAMQQVAGRDPWLQEPLDDDFREAVNDSGEEDPWLP